MSNIVLAFILLSGFVHFLVWLWVLIDEGDCVEEWLNKSPLAAEDWIKFEWLVFIWPITILYLYFKYCFIPTLKGIWISIRYIFKFLLYPFILIYKGLSSLFKNKNKIKRDPIHYRIAKWIVKKYNL